MKINGKYYGVGGIVSPNDSRDYEWKNLGKGAIPFNWEIGYDIETKLPNKLSLKDQNGSSSCGGQAMAYYGEVLEAISTKTQEERSAKFIYSQVCQPGGGSYLRDLCSVVTNKGWATEKVLTSYENGLPPTEAFITRKQDITDEVVKDASISKALSYAVVDRFNIDKVAQAVANNYGAIILLRGMNNGTWLSNMPKVTTGPGEWGHFLYCGKAKLIGGKKYIGVKNSWGDIGDSGWQWISEDFFSNGYVYEVRTMVFKNKSDKFIFEKNLSLNMKNADVLQLQTRLVSEGYATFKPTGYFSFLTLLAVIKYQKAKNIKPAYGYVGELTRACLNQK